MTWSFRATSIYLTYHEAVSTDGWLPIVGVRVLVVITRDRRIRYRPVEKRRWVEHRVRGFVLTGRRSQSTAESLAVIERHWCPIERVVSDRPRDLGCTR